MAAVALAQDFNDQFNECLKRNVLKGQRGEMEKIDADKRACENVAVQPGWARCSRSLHMKRIAAILWPL